MEKITWNKLVMGHGHFQYLLNSFLKGKTFNDNNIRIIDKWLDELKAMLQKERKK